MEQNKRQRDWTMIMIWFIMFVIVVAVVCCVAGFFCHKFEYEDPDNLVVTFLGALAAFVVISNYALMVEIKNKTKDDIEKRQRDLDIMNQKIDALAKGFGIDEIAIKELFNFEEISFRLWESIVMENYYIVTYNNETMLVVVTGTKNNRRARKCSPKEYLEHYRNDPKRQEELKEELMKSGIPRSEFE